MINGELACARDVWAWHWEGFINHKQWCNAVHMFPGP